MTDRSASPVLLAAGALSLLALCAAVSFQKIRTFDYWWHLRTGELIVDSGAVPKVDPFTFTANGEPWIDSHWLHQVGLYAVHSAGGHEAVVLAKFALVVVMVALLASIGFRRSRPGISVAAIALMLLASSERLMPRPELASFTALAAVLALLERERRVGDVRVYAIVPIQLVWANVHGLWVLGLVACGAHLAAEWLRPLRDRGARRRPERMRRLTVVITLSFAAAFANPNGIDGALYPLHFISMLEPGAARDPLAAFIRELDPVIGGRHPLGPLPLTLFFSLMGFSFAAMIANRRRVLTSEPLLWLVFLALALEANRNIALFAIVAAPILVRNLNEFIDTKPTLGLRSGAALAATVPLLVFVAAADVARGGLLAGLRENAEPGVGILERIYPIGAADWIARERPAGPIAHHQADGGYLIWRLFPDYPVMLDGRLEVFGAERLIDLSYATPRAFRRLDARYRFGVVLVHHAWVPSDALLGWLHRSGIWRLAFLDDAAAVFVRRRSGVGGPDLDLDGEALFPPLPGRLGRDDFERRRARANLLYALHRYDRALSLGEKNAARYPDDAGAAYDRARFLFATGNAAAGDVVLDGLLRERPGDARLMARAADLRVAAGRRDEAAALYDAALALDPTLENALAARARLAVETGDPETARALYRRLLEILAPADPAHAAISKRLRRIGDDPPLRRGGE